MPLDSSWRELQDRIFTIQSLSGRLLIDTENRSVLPRIQVHADAAGSLLFKLRIVRGHIAFQAMRPQQVLASHTRNRHVRHLSIPVTQVTVYTGDMGSTLAAKEFFALSIGRVL